MKKVFIDGSAGTTGLRIRERLSERRDLELVILPDEIRKDLNARRDALNSSDISFLCLPDAAAIEAVSLVENPNAVIIDTSTAHRVNPDWTYGFAELSGQRAKIASAKRIANPGCHASGLIALLKPLVENGLLSTDADLCAFSLTGYSGGGKKMIADYDEKLGEAESLPLLNKDGSNSSAPAYLGGRQYALGQTHKHLPEVTKICGLAKAPVFSPIVVPHLSGMQSTVQLHRGNLAAIRECLRDYYGSVGAASLPRATTGDAASSPLRPGVVRYADAVDEGGFISSAALSGRDDMLVSAYGNDERIILVSLFDNLGKGASGAAIQNMNIALGVDETTGLVLG